MTTFEVCYLLSSILVGIVLPVYLLKAYPKYQQFWWNVLPTSPAVVVAVLLEKWYKIPFSLYLAVIPLLRKQGLPEKAREVFEMLRYDFEATYQEKATVGQNYTRQDLIGTPLCVTIDHQTLQDNTVTVRYRDTTEQVRVAIADLPALVGKEVSVKSILEKQK